MRQIGPSAANYVIGIEWQVIMGNITVTGQQCFWGGTIAAIGAFTVITTTSAAQAAPLENFRYNAQSNQLSFVLPDGVKPSYFVMAQPARIVMDIPDTQVGDLPTEQTFSGAVARIEVTQVQPQLVRVILEMSPQAVFARGQVSLENVGDASPGKDLWLLMPLLATQAASPPEAFGRTSPPATISPRSTSVPNPAAASVLPPAAANSSSGAAAEQLPLSAKSVISVPPSVPTVELPPGMESVVGELTSPREPAANVPASMPLPIAPTAVERPPEGETSIAIEVPSIESSDDSTVSSVPPPPVSLPLPSADTTAAAVTPVPVTRPDLQPVSDPPIATQPTVSVPPLASITGASSEGASALPNDRGNLKQTPLRQPLSGQPLSGQAINGQASLNAPEEAIAIAVPEVGSGSTTQDGLPPLPRIAVRGARPAPTSVAVPAIAPVPSAVLPGAQPPLTAVRPAVSPLPAVTPSGSTVMFGQFPGAAGSSNLAAVMSPMNPSEKPTSAAVVEFGQFPNAPVAGRPAIGASPATVGTPMVIASQLPSGHASGMTPVGSVTPGTTGVVEFGQSLSGPTMVSSLTPGLPSTLPTSTAIVADSLPTGGIVIPAGTIVSLRYDQNQTLLLKPGQRQQGILSLQSPIVDTRGQVIVPQGSIVLGEFDTNQDASRFTTQTLSIANRSLPFNAQSELLALKKRTPSTDQFLRNTGIGAGAGAVTGVIAGAFAPLLLGGAAAGAAITYIIAPKEAMIQPGQILQVELIQNFFANPQ